MASSSDQFDLLLAACRTPNIYPTNLLRTKSFRHSLKSYRERLNKQQGSLFDSHPDYYAIDLLEVYDGEDAFRPSKCTTLADLQSHFRIERKDPRCRHVFIQAEHSRAPLDCSLMMFTYLLSFLQVMPRFLDLVFAFGKQAAPKDFHYTAFRHEDYVNQDQSRSFSVPRLGRSGLEMRQCYNLWSVEINESQEWFIRQTAVYHAFDLQTGRALWLNIKANSVIKDRITQATSSSCPAIFNSSADLAGSFASTLMTHLIIFEWSEENWRSYISSLEAKLDPILIKVQNAQIRKVESAFAVDAEALIDPLTRHRALSPHGPSRTSTFSKGHAFSRQSTANADASIPSLQKRVLSGLDEVLPGPTNDSTQVSQGAAVYPNNKSLIDPLFNNIPGSRFEILQQFSLDELQLLSVLTSRLHEASLVMSLNRSILQELITYYTSLISARECPQEIRDGCKLELTDFVQRVNGIIRDLEMEQSRVDTLVKLSDDGKRLFDDILQFKNMEINKLFAVNAHEGGLKMEEMTRDMHASNLNMEKMTRSMHEIAEKTKRETASMHIITLVTLVFLPGTFVATFFGSGLFQWDQNNPLDSPVWKPEFFALFAKICFPLMGGTIVIWLVSYFWVFWKRQQRTAGDEEQCLAANQELAAPAEKAEMAVAVNSRRKRGLLHFTLTLSGIFRRLSRFQKV